MPRRRGGADLDALIEEATVDCNDESEQETGFYEFLNEHLGFPFTGKVVGEEVSITGVDVEEAGIVAICARKGRKYRIALLSVDIPKGVAGQEWLDAYRRFRNLGGEGEDEPEE